MERAIEWAFRKGLVGWFRVVKATRFWVVASLGSAITVCPWRARNRWMNSRVRSREVYGG